MAWLQNLNMRVMLERPSHESLLCWAAIANSHGLTPQDASEREGASSAAADRHNLWKYLDLKQHRVGSSRNGCWISPLETICTPTFPRSKMQDRCFLLQADRSPHHDTPSQKPANWRIDLATVFTLVSHEVWHAGPATQHCMKSRARTTQVLRI